MKGLVRAFIVAAIVFVGLCSMKLAAEVFGPSLKKYYSIEK